MPSLSDTVTPMRYREVIRMPIWLIVVIYFFFLSLVLSIWAAIGDTPALISFVVSTLMLALIIIKSAMVIEVDQGELRVGRAHIDLKFLKAAQALSSIEVRNLRTRDADPAAFLAIRFWSSTGVRVTLQDDRDTTPYWLITSNHADALTSALHSIII